MIPRILNEACGKCAWTPQVGQRRRPAAPGQRIKLAQESPSDFSVDSCAICRAPSVIAIIGRRYFRTRRSRATQVLSERGRDSTAVEFFIKTIRHRPAQRDPPSSPFGFPKGGPLMVQNQSKPILVIDVRLHLRGRLYQLRLADALKWLVPLVVVIVRIVAALRRSP